MDRPAACCLLVDRSPTSKGTAKAFRFFCFLLRDYGLAFFKSYIFIYYPDQVTKTSLFLPELNRNRDGNRSASCQS
jgi:hypothetical protein